ncbi:iron complex outermembrane receptor protein [Novosphingobium sp. SG751A]|uniref:TonB-dependent receptor n=1 Tax=Novosphingobium sp. SG751A TaxID=2587000 RepID=UPI001556FD58|nr:TonB-dependent receptor [Novosphingobium sp. SG751A]NOW47305.1 iron complex outermembrane receptor protein [Novosphingobium sp. SG751A]
MRIIKNSALAVSSFAIAAAVASPAFAQSTGSVDFENTIVVTGTKAKAINGVDIPATPKAKQVLDQSFISKSSPGQTINDVINMVPGVSFFNADPFGSSGGAMFIRGFDSTRISQTFDGMPLNDTGNYALYSNQQLDAELIEQVNVNLGSTDVDSPTAAASGSTVNYRSRDPLDKAQVMAVGSAGDLSFKRGFISVDTGTINNSGLKAWFAASVASNRFLPNTGGQVAKQQLNFKVKQPLGDNGDFISLAGHFNLNRNNFAPSMSLYTQNSASRPINSSSGGRVPYSWDEAQYTINCADTTSSTASTTGYGAFECRYNPSRTANLRMNSRFTLADNLILTIDPSFQYTKANGGGTSKLNEGTGPNGWVGNIGGSYYAGTDVNANGVVDPALLIGTANETETNRIGLLTSLRWKINPTNTLRVGYSYDRGRHKQTGELTFLNSQTGYYATYFPIDLAIKDKYGNAIQKRNRMSYAILHQVSAEYNGKFFDGKLDVLVGVRAPFFKRNLTNFCFTFDGGGSNFYCPSPQDQAAYAAANPYSFNSTTNKPSGYAVPQQRIYNYNRVLPNVGFTLALGQGASLYANYSQGLQVPSTDTLYGAFYYPASTSFGSPGMETSDNFDVGLRARAGRLSASVGGWYTMFNNKISQVYNQETQTSIFTNLGKVEKYGFDATLNWKVDDHFSIYAFGSYNKSRILADIVAGQGATGTVLNGNTVLRSDGTNTYYLTAGKRESGVPIYTAGARLDASFDPFDLTVSVKNNGKRYINAENLPVYSSLNPSTAVQVNSATLPSYTTVDLSARMKLAIAGLKSDKSFIQINVTNLFNQYYYGGFTGTSTPIAVNTVPTVYLATPRTVVATLSVAF